MIAGLEGTVTGRDEKTLVLDVHGVAFRINVLPRTIEQFPLGATAKLVTHLHVREDALELFGFALESELRLFDKLISVSGVGPRMALAVLGAASAQDLEQAIEQGQAGILTKVSGVGTKTAERIIVDLRGKLDLTAGSGDTSLSTVVDALVQLGYSAREAREAAAATPSDVTVEERIKAALKRMSS